MAPRLKRLLLAINAATLLPLAVWPLVSPTNFYKTFPGLGMHWIDINGPYNEHFLRDFGALNAALLVVVVYALFKPAIEQAAGFAIAIYALPHAIYHLGHLDVYESSQKIPAVAPLVLQIFMGLAIGLLPSPSSHDRTPALDRTT